VEFPAVTEPRQVDPLGLLLLFAGMYFSEVSSLSYHILTRSKSLKIFWNACYVSFEYLLNIYSMVVNWCQVSKLDLGVEKQKDWKLKFFFESAP